MRLGVKPMTTHVIFLNGATVVTPDADGWDAFLAMSHPSQWDETWRATPDSLAVRARRRLSPQILLAISVAEKINPTLAQNAAWVFASSVGEGETLKIILDALSTPQKAIQPLRFQNSVHNAASGQWTIAAGLTNPATSISAQDYTAGAAMLKASLQVQIENRPVGVVLYDAPLPAPLNISHKINIPLGVGLSLAPNSGPETIAKLEIAQSEMPAKLPLSKFPQIPENSVNPVQDMLPLLNCFAGQSRDDVFLALSPHSGLSIKVTLL